MIFWQSYVKVVEKLFDSLEADVSVHHVEREGFLFAGLLSTDFEGTTIPFFSFCHIMQSMNFHLECQKTISTSVTE